MFIKALNYDRSVCMGSICYSGPISVVPKNEQLHWGETKTEQVRKSQVRVKPTILYSCDLQGSKPTKYLQVLVILTNVAKGFNFIVRRSYKHILKVIDSISFINIFYFPSSKIVLKIIKGRVSVIRTEVHIFSDRRLRAYCAKFYQKKLIRFRFVFRKVKESEGV